MFVCAYFNGIQSLVGKSKHHIFTFYWIYFFFFFEFRPPIIFLLFTLFVLLSLLSQLILRSFTSNWLPSAPASALPFFPNSVPMVMNIPPVCPGWFTAAHTCTEYFHHTEMNPCCQARAYFMALCHYELQDMITQYLRSV